MKMPSIIKRKKLRAATARRSRAMGLPDAMDYEQMSEPNMKLSRALLIVLLLHIVAVAGIIAFNTIKTREAVTGSVAETAIPVSSDPASAATAAESAPGAADEITQVAAKVETKAPAKAAESAKSADPPKSAAKTSEVADSGKIYTVVRGDNPVTIARHFHVKYEALLGLNQITDPRKLQIGQKLHIPEPEATAKHKSNHE
ncbi:MAG: LysM peptidoglycan-binding domain-containing protein [Chthoniobacterales bacterium]